MPDFAVKTAFVAQDHVTKAYGNMSKAAGRFEDKAVKSFRNASKSASRFGDITKGILTAGFVQDALAGLRTGITELASSYRSFDDAAIAATVRFSDIDVSAEAVAKNLGRIKAAARDAGATTEYTATQGAEALDFFARAGWDSVSAIDSLVPMINLATASGTDFSQAADWSTDLLGGFGMAVDDVEQKIKNLNRLNNVIVGTTNSANVNFEQMFETMKVGAPIATTSGSTLEYVAAMTAVMANAGIKAERGGTALKNIFMRLSAPTSEVLEGFRQLGIVQSDIADGAGRMRPITEIFRVINTRLSGLKEFERIGVMKKIFGAFALAGATILVKNVESIEKFHDYLIATEGVSKKTADIMRVSLGNRLKLLGSAAVDAGFKLLSAFRPEIIRTIDSIADSIRYVNFDPLIATIRPVVRGLEWIFDVISQNSEIFKTLAVGAGSWLAVMSVTALGKIAMAFKGLTVAIWAFNIAMLANPIGIAAAAIAVLMMAAFLLYRHWDKVVAGIQLGIDTLTDAFKIAFEVIRRVFFDPFIFITSKIFKLFTGTTSLDQMMERMAARHAEPINRRLGDAARQREAQDIHRAMIETYVQSRQAQGRSVLDVNFNNAPAGTTAVPGRNNELDINTVDMGYLP